MDTIPPVVPALTRPDRFARNLSADAPIQWLRAGLRDFVVDPISSLLYGFGVFVVSVVVIFTLFWTGDDAVLFPALAGFMIIGPAMAIGLYEKSRLLELNEPVTIKKMLSVRAQARGQVLFAGAILCLLLIAWMRVAVLLYALFFGVRGFPGIENIASTLLTTPVGLSLLIAGTLVGGLFAAGAFSLSVFSVPMLMDKPVGAFTALGVSLALAWQNRYVLSKWAAFVMIGFLLCLVTGLVGLIVVFPVIGHASWHAYRAVQE